MTPLRTSLGVPAAIRKDLVIALFARYPARPDEVVGSAAALVVAAGNVNDLSQQVQQQAQDAQAAVDGDLAIPLATATLPVSTTAAEVSLSARYTAGVLTAFAGDVSTFDVGVDELNRRWEGLGPVTEPIEMRARDALLEQLQSEYALLEQSLDEAAAAAAGMLDRGPNDADIAALTTAGLMPSAIALNDPALSSALAAGTGVVFNPAATAEQRAAWWAGLSAAERRAVLTAYPSAVGSGDGLPAEARDEANRILLEADLSELQIKEHSGTLTDEEERQLAGIRAIAEEIETIEGSRDPVTGEPMHAQLYIYDPAAYGGDGRAAVVTGNLDTADHVAFMVPGLGTTTAGMGGARALNVYNESRWAAGAGEGIAVVDWVGYDAPSGDPIGGDAIGVLNQDMAREGAEILAADVSGYRASRGDEQPHITVAGNSYGSSTTAISADEYGLEADDVILTGSPGAGDADDADDLSTGRDHTWVGAASHDFVTSLGVTGWADPSQVGAGLLSEFGLPTDTELMGNDPAEDEFEANRFAAENVDRLDGTHIDTDNPEQSVVDGWNIIDHSRYYDPGTESLYNVAAVVTGNYPQVQPAEYRYDPLVGGDLDVDASVDASVDGSVDAGMCEGPLGVPYPCVDVDLDVDVDVDVDVEVDVDADVDVGMQDPERDRTPEEMSHGR